MASISSYLIGPLQKPVDRAYWFGFELDHDGIWASEGSCRAVGDIFVAYLGLIARRRHLGRGYMFKICA